MHIKEYLMIIIGSVILFLIIFYIVDAIIAKRQVKKELQKMIAKCTTKLRITQIITPPLEKTYKKQSVNMIMRELGNNRSIIKGGKF